MQMPRLPPLLGLQAHLGEHTTPEDAKTATEWCGTRVLRQSEESAQRYPDYKIIPGDKGGAPPRGPRAATGSQQQPTHRSQRLLRKKTLSPERDNTQIRRTIYVIGDLSEDDLSEWDQLLHNFHTDDVLQDTVDDVLRRMRSITSNARPQEKKVKAMRPRGVFPG
jgi:hypothetical protein